MSIVNTRDKTINTKIVYYGTGLGGKTTSLRCVHACLDPGEKVKMVSLKTDEERTLFFDFLPIDLGMLGGYKIRVQGFTVPGQVKYNLTRKYVLMGADAVVFVADSQKSRLEENVVAMANLGENLAANGLSIKEIPVVLQYNKRDLPDTSSIEELEEHLNGRNWKSFATDALQKRGVYDAFIQACELMLRQVAKRYDLKSEQGEIGEAVRHALEVYMQPQA